jgi:hypothetical protein
MNVIKSIFIPCVDSIYDANYITDALYLNGIATIGKITLLPFTKKTGTYNRAYVDICEWHETESAYNFVNGLRSNTREVRFVHNDDNWWTFEINKKPYITSVEKYETYTTDNCLALNIDKPWQFNPWNEKTNDSEAKLLSQIRDIQEWKELEIALFDMLEYQNLEYELCL